MYRYIQTLTLKKGVSVSISSRVVYYFLSQESADKEEAPSNCPFFVPFCPAPRHPAKKAFYFALYGVFPPWVDNYTP